MKREGKKGFFLNLNQHRRFGIGKRLIIYFSMVSLIPCLVMALVAVSINMKALENSTRNNLSCLLRDCGRKISLFMNHQYQDIKMLSLANTFKSDDNDAKQKFIEAIYDCYPFYEAITVHDKNGNIIACTNKKFIASYRGARPWFQAALVGRQGDVVPIDAYRSEAANWKIVIGLNCPVTNKTGDMVIGVLSTRVKMEYFLNRVISLSGRIGKNTKVYLINRKGLILEGSDKKDFLKPHQSSEHPVVELLLSGQTGIIEYVNDRNEAVIGAYYSLEGEGDFDGWGWGLFMTELKKDIYSSTYMIRNIAFLLIIVISLLVTAVTILITRSISRPILKIARVAQMISQEGLRNIKIEYRKNDEINQLVSAFNKMVDDLDRTMTSRDLLSKEIKERKKVEEQLRENEQKFRILSDQSLLGIAIVQDGVLKYANEAFHRIFDNSQDEVLNRKSDKFLQFLHNKKQTTEDGFAHSDRSRLITTNRANKWIEVYSKKILFDCREAEMITVLDVSARKGAEEKAKLQQQQLIQADKLSSLGVMVAGVAHEINNPNQFIMSNAPLLKGTWESIIPILDEYNEENGDFVVNGLNYSIIRGQIPAYLDRITEGSKRINKIVNDLKSFARQDEQGLMVELDINMVVEASITLIT